MMIVKVFGNGQFLFDYGTNDFTRKIEAKYYLEIFPTFAIQNT
jgi:hypothetical protein